MRRRCLSWCVRQRNALCDYEYGSTHATTFDSPKRPRSCQIEFVDTDRFSVAAPGHRFRVAAPITGLWHLRTLCSAGLPASRALAIGPLRDRVAVGRSFGHFGCRNTHCLGYDLLLCRWRATLIGRRTNRLQRTPRLRLGCKPVVTGAGSLSRDVGCYEKVP